MYVCMFSSAQSRFEQSMFGILRLFAVGRMAPLSVHHARLRTQESHDITVVLGICCAYTVVLLAPQLVAVCCAWHRIETC